MKPSLRVWASFVTLGSKITDAKSRTWIPRSRTCLAAFVAATLATAASSVVAADIVPGARTAEATCASILHSVPAMIKQVEASPALKLRAMKLVALFTSENPDRLVIQSEAAQLLAQLRDEGVLRPAMAYALREAKKHPKFPKNLPGDDAQMIDMFYTEIDAALVEIGLSVHGAKAAAKNWLTLAKEQTAALLASGVAKIRDSLFVTEIQKLIRANFHGGGTVRLLNRADEALRVRKEMILGAEKSIHLMTWAMYGDVAGKEFAELLIQRFKDGIDVRVMVDGLTAQRTGYKESLDQLRAAGVPVIEYRGTINPYHGQHRKFMIVDAETGSGQVVAGGRNLGDQYLHTAGEAKDHWRDTDIHYTGANVRDNAMLFTKLWNEQIDRLVVADAKNADEYRKLMMSKEKAAIRQRRVQGGVRMAVVNHTPNPEGIDPIYLGLLKSIEASETSIDIANAYVILTPAMRDALIRARKRGVKVRIFTNSAQSVDEPVVSVPILKSLAELIPHGIEVHLKQGSTLHSKFAIFDNELSWVMSYNLHPRSLIYEGEVANVILDAKFARLMTEDFELDLKEARAVSTVADLNIPTSAISDIAGTYFYNRL